MVIFGTPILWTLISCGFMVNISQIKTRVRLCSSEIALDSVRHAERAGIYQPD